ncbi:hypothetical protein MYX84_07325 [Acidobacteria bacterium AH-259-O06]|nr:hypothetical protein [Acidobacteria bacterium AH-259-O06]
MAYRKQSQLDERQFFIDRQGVIRYIHPGGQYVKGDPDYKTLVKKIEELLDGALE